MKKLCLAVIVLSICSLSFAQVSITASKSQQLGVEPQKSGAATQVSPSPESSAECSFNFSSGGGNTFLSYCVSVNGNVLGIVTPVGHQQVFAREGYGICDFNSNTAYFDYGLTGTTTNWNDSSVLSSKPTLVKIARTTSDGIWTLTQTIAQVAKTSSIKVTMTLKNNTKVSHEVQLSRFIDVDAEGTTRNTIDATINDAMIYNSVGRGSPYGLALQNVGTSPFTYLGFVRNVDTPMDPCSPFTNQALGPLTDTDGTGIMTYVITIPAGASKTVNVGYRGL